MAGLERYTRNAHLWLPQYLAAQRRRPSTNPARAWLTITDHFEPCWKKPDPATARERVRRWRRRWPEIAARHRDSAGRPPCYCFFFPEEEYQPEFLDPLAELKALGIADVEVHIHHDGEGRHDFLDRMSRFLETLATRHGLLRRVKGRTVFGFIHGNWCLDNARPDGRYCGLNDEITLLRDLGCYADFTLPCVPDASQAGPVNSIYWATDDPARPRSHAHGVPVVAGGAAGGDLLMITGPLAVHWIGRPWWKPRIETGELASNDPPRAERCRLWLEHAPRIGQDVFIKLYGHSAQEDNAACLLDGGLDTLFSSLAAICQAAGIELRYVSAWEMRQAVDRAVTGVPSSEFRVPS
jgi:hypothetical protein